jgi:hypothetical protein
VILFFASFAIGPITVAAANNAARIRTAVLIACPLFSLILYGTGRVPLSSRGSTAAFLYSDPVVPARHIVNH